MTKETPYPEIQALLVYFEKHNIEIRRLGDFRHHDLIHVAFTIDGTTWNLYVDDEYKDFQEDRPVMCLYLVLFSLEMYLESDDFLSWCNQWFLDTKDPKWLQYYRDLGSMTREIEQRLGTIDAHVSDYEYQLRMGVVDALNEIREV